MSPRSLPTHSLPRLSSFPFFRLCTIFLAFDVFFVLFCVALACVIGLAVCCCLPCIIAILYAVADQEGASEDDIKALPKYHFALPRGEQTGGVLTLVAGQGAAARARPSERQVATEDAVRRGWAELVSWIFFLGYFFGCSGFFFLGEMVIDTFPSEESCFDMLLMRVLEAELGRG